MKLKEDFIKLMKTYKSIKTVVKGSENSVSIHKGFSQIDLQGEENIRLIIDTDTDIDTAFVQESVNRLVNLKIKETVEILEDKVILDGKEIGYIPAEQLDVKDLSKLTIDFTCKATDFKQALKGVLPAIGTDVARPILNNVLVDGDTLVTVDGYRVFTRVMPIESDAYTLIPQSVAKLLEKLLPTKGNDVLTISGYEQDKAITWGDFTVIYKEQQGEFIKWKQTFSDNCEYQVSVNREQLIEELEWLANTQEEPKKAIAKLTIEREAIVVGKDKRLDANVRYSPTRKYEPLKIVFSIKFLLDSLKSIKDEDVVLRFISALTPVFIDGRDLVLPIRIN